MRKRTREIIALVMLIVLGIAGISAMAWYILVGHNWNAAATNIDDRIGNMEGYTVILCEGPSRTPDEGGQPYLAWSSAMRYAGLADRVQPAKDARRLTLAEAIASYREKGADVLKIHCDDRAAYDSPVITQRSGKRFAVFSVSGRRSDIAATVKARLMRRYDIDFTICIIDGPAIAERGLDGVDMAICAHGMAADEEGRYIDGTYVVAAPPRYHVGAVIMSPSGFLTSKMLDVA